MPLTWDPNFNPSAFALTSGNTKVTATQNAGSQQIIANEFHTTGKWYVENTFNWDASGVRIMFQGIALANTAPGDFTGQDPSSLGWQNPNPGNFGDGGVGTNNVLLGAPNNGGSWTAGAHGGNTSQLGTSLDLDNGLVWFSPGVDIPTNWNNSGAANPATGVGGIPIPVAMKGKPLTIATSFFFPSNAAFNILCARPNLLQAVAPAGFHLWDYSQRDFGNGFILTSAGGSTALLGPFNLLGGKYALSLGANSQTGGTFDMLGPDGSTWIVLRTFGVDAANSTIDLPPGQYGVHPASTYVDFSVIPVSKHR